MTEGSEAEIKKSGQRQKWEGERVTKNKDRSVGIEEH